MKYVAYDNFDNFYVNILGICDTEADVQELILAAAEEEACRAFLDDYYYDEIGFTVGPGDDPVDTYLKDNISEWEDYNKFKSPFETHNISFYGWTHIMTGKYYNYSIGEEY